MAKTRKRGGLTKPQWELLCRAFDFEKKHKMEYSQKPTYKPLIALERLGLVTTCAPIYSKHITVTPAGRKLVEDVRRMERE